jgi:hypothetical protein
LRERERERERDFLTHKHTPAFADGRWIEDKWARTDRQTDRQTEVSHAQTHMQTPWSKCGSTRMMPRSLITLNRAAPSPTGAYAIIP